MSYLRSSQNYIWNTSAVLGKGATGAVYAGLHRATGESVAVKSFNHLSQLRPYEVQRREFEVLKKVNHENIVRLLAIEDESDSKQKVLIMELCTGGSLFNILDDPVNCYGLEETEFLLVLKHLAAGMKHLRDNNIMHRDLKPGNIMKYIKGDGSSSYKLTDFGAARELEDDQQFMSLYGTEEYLHPDMYERAVLRKPAGKTFKANFDLWSIGVTMFHIATGSLPFKPFGGRKNKETMYKITTEKKSGIICGVQHTEAGEIEWSRNLPKTCLLSPGCQQLVTKLLAGLMECQTPKMWSFEQFFDSVTHILCHKVYHIFYVNNMRDVILYVNPKETTHDVRSRLKMLLSIPVESQLLLFNNQQVMDIHELTTTAEKPIILLNSDPTKMKPSPIKSSSTPKFPDLRISTPMHPQYNSRDVRDCPTLDQDAQLAKLASSMAYSVHRIIQKCTLYYNLARNTPLQVISFIEINVTLLFEKQQACSHLYTSLKIQLQNLSTTSNHLSLLRDNYLDQGLFDPAVNFAANVKPQQGVDPVLRKPSDPAPNDINQCLSRGQQLFAHLSDYWSGLSKKMNSMKEKVKELNDKWTKESLTSSDRNMGSAPTRSKHYCQKVKDSWQTLHRDKTNRVLSHSEDQLHQLEKIKIENNCKKLSDQLCNICYKSLDEVTEKLEDWYTGAQVIIVQSDCLFKELVIFMNQCEELQQHLRDMKEEENRLWSSLLEVSSRKQDVHLRNPARNQEIRQSPPLSPTARIPTQGDPLAHSYSQKRQPVHLHHQPTLPVPPIKSDLSSLFFSCENGGSNGFPLLPSNVIQEISRLREAHTRLMSALEENQALTSEFESLSTEPSNHF